MSLTNKIKSGIALTGLAVGNMLFNSGCQSVTESKEYQALDSFMQHPLETVKEEMERPGAGMSLLSVAAGVAAGNANTNQEFYGALGVQALANNSAENERLQAAARTAGQTYSQNQGNNQNVTSSLKRELRVRVGKDKNNDGMLDAREAKNEVYFIPSWHNLFGLEIDNTNRPEFTARIAIYKEGNNTPIFEIGNLAQDGDRGKMYTLDRNKHLNGPGKYKVCVYEGNNLTATQEFETLN